MKKNKTKKGEVFKKKRRKKNLEERKREEEKRGRETKKIKSTFYLKSAETGGRTKSSKKIEVPSLFEKEKKKREKREERKEKMFSKAEKVFQ